MAKKAVADIKKPKVVGFAPLAAKASVKPFTIGLWDLGAWLGGLTRLIEAMNAVQNSFVFFEVKGTVPAGLISQPQRVIPWLRDCLGRSLTSEEEHDIKQNLIANDYFGLAEAIRSDFQIDLLVGIAPSMVAGNDEEEVYWNHFSTFYKATALVSTHDLREYAERTGRPFETFLACLIIAQVLVALFYPKLGFHDDRGCLFDYNADRVSLMKKGRDLRIEEECQNSIPKSYRPAAQVLMRFLSGLAKE